MVPVFSLFNYISSGPHTDSHGRFDDRVWFYIQVGQDEDTGTVTFLKFPFGASEDEIIEEEIEVSIWTD